MIQIRDHVALSAAVLRELATERKPAMRVDVDPLARKCVAGLLALVARSAVVEVDPRAARWLGGELEDFAPHRRPLVRGEITVALHTARNRLRQDEAQSHAAE